MHSYHVYYLQSKILTPVYYIVILIMTDLLRVWIWEYVEMEDCFCRGELKFLKTSSNKVWVVLMAVNGHFLEFLIILWNLFQFSFLKMVLTHQPAAAFHVCETHLHLHTFTFLLLYWGRAISIFALTAAGRDLDTRTGQLVDGPPLKRKNSNTCLHDKVSKSRQMTPNTIK